MKILGEILIEKILTSEIGFCTIIMFFSFTLKTMIGKGISTDIYANF